MRLEVLTSPGLISHFSLFSFLLPLAENTSLKLALCCATSGAALVFGSVCRAVLITPLISYLGCLTSSITHLQPQLTNPCCAVGLPCPGCTVSHHRLSVCYLFCSPWFIWLLHLFISHDISRLGLYISTHNTNGISLSSLYALWVILFFLS